MAVDAFLLCQPTSRILEAIDLDNYLDGSERMPAGGVNEVRSRIRALKSAHRPMPAKYCQPLRRDEKLRALELTIRGRVKCRLAR